MLPNLRREKVVTLLSGGMDSSTLVVHFLDKGFQVYPITIYYGQKHAKEIDAAQSIIRHYNLRAAAIDLNQLASVMSSAQTDYSIAVPEGHYAEETMKQTVTPNRNMTLLSIATAYAITIGAKKVGYAAHAGDHAIYPDCRPQFMSAMGNVMDVCHFHPIVLSTPFALKTKTEILQFGLGLGVPYQKTWSCYNGRDKACGKCGTCVERLEAFHNCDVADPIEYEDREWWKSQVKP